MSNFINKANIEYTEQQKCYIGSRETKLKEMILQP